MDKVIAISRQYGSGGRQIGKLASERLRIPFYDREMIQEAVLRSGLCAESFAGANQIEAGSRLYSTAPGAPSDLPVKDKLYLAQREAIRKLNVRGPCVLVGRSACTVIRGQFQVLRVIIYADIETRIRRAVEEYQEPTENIEKRLDG